MLDQFLDSHSQMAWAPGTVDCCLVLADWAVTLGHADPAAHLRGAYDSDDGFFAIIERAGGVVPLVGSCAVRVGAAVDQAQCGDIGVVGSVLNMRRQFGAIFDGRRWMVRNAGGFIPMTARVLSVWRLACPR